MRDFFPGTFTLTFEGETTSPIDANADEAEVESKIEGTSHPFFRKHSHPQKTMFAWLMVF